MSRSQFLWFAALLLLTSCAPSGAPVTGQVKQTPSVNGPTPPATLTVSSPTLGPVPHNCPISNPVRHTISPKLGSVIGTSPVWAAWPPGPNIFHLTPPPNSPYPSTYEPPYGWYLTKVVWEVGPDYHQLVTIRGYTVSDHTSLLFQLSNDTPTADAVLDPQHPGHPRSAIGDGWAEWGSYIVVPRAGCYLMKVSWSTGQWALTFAVGA